MITNNHKNSLELEKVLLMLSGLASCEGSRQMALELQPSFSYKACQKQMQLTADAHTLSCKFGSPGVLNIKTTAVAALKKASVGARLTTREILDIAAILQTVSLLHKYQKEAAEEGLLSLAESFLLLGNFTPLERRIADIIISEEEISDFASPALSTIRQKLRSTKQSIRTQLDGMIRSTTYQKYLQEQIITLRNGRYVVPVKAEYRSEVRGMLHDTSSSGATVFIEPMAVVEANNDIRILEQKETEEIDRILHELSVEIGKSAEQIEANYQIILELDLLFAKTRLGLKMRAGIPQITNDYKITLKNARHPLIAVDKVVPINVTLGEEFDVLVITGPNTGGKTVVLKTMGLLTLMMMCGLMIPAGDGSSISVFEDVLVDIGDEQSIEQSLSTFSAHMTNIVSIMEVAKAGSLVLFDELGSGTDPVEGAALAVSIIQQLMLYGCKVVATTHYPEIKLFAFDTQRVENGSCEFDVETLKPTYKLLIGVPGRSNAFAISQRLGLSQNIIENAKNYVSPENSKLEDMVAELEKTRLELEKEKLTAQMLNKEVAKAKKEAAEIHRVTEEAKQKELERARAKAMQMVEDVKFSAGRMLNELEDIKKQKDSDGFEDLVAKARSQYNKHLDELYNKADPVEKKKVKKILNKRQIKIGDNVFSEEFNKAGTALTNEDAKGQVTVQLGVMKMQLSAAALRLQEDKPKVTYKGGNVSLKGVKGNASRSGSTELDLRGYNLDSALLDLDKFIDNCVLSGIKVVTIIHGKGTGVLRSGITEHLRKHKSVENYRLGNYGEGESGVTILELK